MINPLKKNLPNKISKNFFHLSNHLNSKNQKKDSGNFASITRQIKILSRELPMMKLLMRINISLKILNLKSFHALKYKTMMISNKKNKTFNKKKEAKNSKIISRLINLSKRWNRNKQNNKKRKNNRSKFNQIFSIF